MAQQVSHSTSDASSELSPDSLPTLSAKARARASALRRLADDLDLHSHTDIDGEVRLFAVAAYLHDGDSAMLEPAELQYARAVAEGR